MKTVKVDDSMAPEIIKVYRKKLVEAQKQVDLIKKMLLKLGEPEDSLSAVSSAAPKKRGPKKKAASAKTKSKAKSKAKKPYTGKPRGRKPKNKAVENTNATTQGAE